MLAAPFCPVLMRVVFMPTRSFWQELAWLFSAVFWCALGALCYLFISSLFSHRRKTPIAPSGRGRCQSNQAKRFRFSLPMLQNPYSRRYVFDRQKSAVRFLQVYLRFFQIRFSNAFSMDINIAVVEIVAFFAQFFRQLFCTHAIRAPRRPKITVNISLLEHKARRRTGVIMPLFTADEKQVTPVPLITCIISVKHAGPERSTLCVS